MTSEELEQLRRSLVMAPADGPATVLTNSRAAALLDELIDHRNRERANTSQPEPTTPTPTPTPTPTTSRPASLSRQSER